MNMWKTSIGFEIFGNDLRIAVLKFVFGKIQFAAAHTVEGFVRLDNVQQRETLLRLFRKQRIGHGQYTLTLPHDSGIIRQLEFPSQIRDKLKSVVALQVETLSPWSLDEVYWDYSVEAASGASTTVTVNVAVVPRSAVDPWIAFFKSAGFPLRAAAISSMTYAHGAATMWQDSRPTVILSCSDIAVEGVI